KAWACILNCHIKRASGKLDDAAEDACEYINAGKGCYDKLTGSIIALGSSCPSCLLGNVAFNLGYNDIQSNNNLIYCGVNATTTTTTTTLPDTCGGSVCNGTCSSGVICTPSLTALSCVCPTTSQCQAGGCIATSVSNGSCTIGASDCPAGYSCVLVQIPGG